MDTGNKEIFDQGEITSYLTINARIAKLLDIDHMITLIVNTYTDP